MTRILACAEAFGFGPASKLHAISIELARRDIEIHFVGNAASLTFVESNAEAFGSIVAMDSTEELAKIAPDGYDVALSVMDPYLPLWAHINGVPCVYVDSLYWFWQWAADREPELRHLGMRLAASPDAQAAFHALDAVPMHDSQYVAHWIATASCVQNAPKVGARAAVMRGLGRVEVVDAVIDLSHCTTTAPDRWLATTSGMINPLLPFESAVEWTRTVAHLLEEASALSRSNAPITLAGNPDVLAGAADVASDRIELKPMSHGEILQAMNGALACLTPPGLTTMMECAAYGTPFILLPEQHYGHLSNYREVFSCGDAATVPHGLIDPHTDGPTPNNVLNETLHVSDQLKRHFTGRTEVWARMVRGIAEGMRDACTDRERLRSAQDTAMRRFVGGYAGARQVADAIESILGMADRPREQ